MFSLRLQKWTGNSMHLIAMVGNVMHTQHSWINGTEIALILQINAVWNHIQCDYRILSDASEEEEVENEKSYKRIGLIQINTFHTRFTHTYWKIRLIACELCANGFNAPRLHVAADCERNGEGHSISSGILSNLLGCHKH